MGSGLILLVIVGAWLAVLVPMFVRSHDSSAALSSVDRFSDAMRVLSRRQGGGSGRRAVIVPRRPDPAAAAAFAHVSGGSARPRPTTAPLVGAPAPSRTVRSAGPTAAERRRRTLLVLLVTALLTLLLAVAGVGGLLAVHVAADLLVAGFVVHCRRQAVLAAQRRRRVPQQRPARPAAAGFERMPARPAPLRATAPTRAARFDEGGVVASAPASAPAAAGASAAAVAGDDRARPAAAIGDEWSPVPVPRPVYTTKAAAPPRVLDLTRPGRWSEGLEDLEIDLAEDDDLDAILDRRRVVGG